MKPIHWWLIAVAIILIFLIRWWLKKPAVVETKIDTKVVYVDGKPRVVGTSPSGTGTTVTFNNDPRTFKAFQPVYAGESVPVYGSELMIGSLLKTVNIGNIIGYFSKVLPSGVVELSEGAPPALLGRQMYIKASSIVYVK